MPRLHGAPLEVASAEGTVSPLRPGGPTCALLAADGFCVFGDLQCQSQHPPSISATVVAYRAVVAANAIAGTAAGTTAGSKMLGTVQSSPAVHSTSEQDIAGPEPEPEPAVEPEPEPESPQLADRAYQQGETVATVAHALVARRRAGPAVAVLQV